MVERESYTFLVLGSSPSCPTTAGNSSGDQITNLCGGMKYIIGREGAIVFDDRYTHAEMAAGKGKIYGAGFVRFSPSSDEQTVYATCFGNSVSLGIESRPGEDSEAINYLLNPPL